MSQKCLKSNERDLNGRAYAIETLNAHQLLVLYHQPIEEKALV